jgi:NodT family efflux transporter outer membrane factor (OMF) lipoprotein
MKTFSPHISFVMIALVALVSCAVGPNFRSPDMATPDHYTAAPLPAQTAGTPSENTTAQRFAFDKDLPGEWWTLFRSDSLDRLVRMALDNSPTLIQAQAMLKQAQEDLNARTGATQYPAVDAGLSVTRQQMDLASYGISNIPNPGPFNLYNASVSVSYTMDIFGGNRRALEGFKAKVDYQDFELEAARQTLTANVVTTAIMEASLREQIDVTKAILAAEQGQLDVIQKQFELGAVSKTEVLAQETELAMTKAGMPPLEKQFDLNRHALSVLIGQFPGDGKLPEFSLESLHLP